MFNKVKSVDDILATFANMVKELSEIETRKKKEASALLDQAIILKGQASVKEEEANRAANVANKISQIIE